MLREAAEDLLAISGFPVPQRKTTWSTDLPEWLDEEIARRNVGISPPPALCCGWPARCWSRALYEWRISDRRPLRRLDAHSRQPHGLAGGGGAAGTDRVIVAPPLTNAR